MSQSVWGPGIAAGIVAGMFMAFWSMIVAAANGLGLWLPIKLVAGTFLGVNVIIYGGGTVLFGFALHFLMASAWSVLFGSFYRRNDAAGSAVAGLCYGAVVWAFMRFLILPWLDPTMSERVALTAWSFFVAHLIYGLVLGISVSAFRQAAPVPARRLESPA